MTDPVVPYTNANYEVIVNMGSEAYDVRNAKTGIIEYTTPVLPQAIVVAEQFNKMLVEPKIIETMVNAAYRWADADMFDEDGILSLINPDDMAVN